MNRSLILERKLRTLFWLFIAGFAFRALHLLVFWNDIIPNSDQMQEIMLARKFAAGDLYGVLDVYWAPAYPILIGLVSSVTDSPIIPAVTVSLIAGSLAVPLTYILVQQSYGRREGLIAAALAIYFPHLINSVFELGSENVYIVFVIGALITTWAALASGRISLYFGAGILLGLAYLTRPEGFGYPFFFVAVILVFSFLSKEFSIKRVTPHAGALLLGFVLLSIPYLVYLKGETGRWTISGKSEINTIAGDIADHEDEVPATETPDTPARKFAKYFALNLVDAHKRLPILLPPGLILLAGVGLFGSVWTAGRARREIFLISFCLITIVGYAAAVIQVRYFYVLLPVMFGWVALGITRFSTWFLRSVRSVSRGELAFRNRTIVIAVVLVAIYLYVLPLNFYTVSADTRWETRAFEERSAGLWLKQNTPRDERIFSASRRPAFYAEREQFAPTSTDQTELLRELRIQNVKYAVTSHRSLRRNPYMKGLDEVLASDPNWERVYYAKPHGDYWISVYRSR